MHAQEPTPRSHGWIWKACSTHIIPKPCKGINRLLSVVIFTSHSWTQHKPTRNQSREQNDYYDEAISFSSCFKEIYSPLMMAFSSLCFFHIVWRDRLLSTILFVSVTQLGLERLIPSNVAQLFFNSCLISAKGYLSVVHLLLSLAFRSCSTVG